MGGKTETMSGFGSGHIFKQTDNLMFKDLVRTYAMGISTPIDIFKVLIRNSSLIFNYRVLDKYGMTSEINVVSSVLSNESVLSYVKLKVDDTAESINSYGATEALYPLFTAYLDLKYSFTNGSKHFTYECTDEIGHAYSISSKNYEMDPTDDGNGNMIPDFNDNGSQYEVKLVNNADSSDIKYELVPYDKTIYLLIQYTDSSGDSHCIFTSKDSILTEAFVYHAVMLPLKKDFNNLLTNKKNAFLSKFGFKHDSFDNVLDDSDTKHVCLTFSSSKDNINYKDTIEKIYGINNDPGTKNTVTIVEPYNIVYQEENDDSDGSVYYNATFDDVPIDLTSFNYIIPIDIDIKKGVDNRYEIYKECFNYFGVAEKDVHIAWYETPFFQFAMIMAGIVAFAFTGNPMFLLPLAMKVGMEIITSMFGSDVARYIGYAVSIILLLTGDWSDLMSIIANTASTAATISNMYFDYEMDKIADTIENIDKTSKKLKDEADKLRSKNAIIIKYNPMETYDQFYYQANNFISNNLYAYQKPISPFSNAIYNPFKF